MLSRRAVRVVEVCALAWLATWGCGNGRDGARGAGDDAVPRVAGRGVAHVDAGGEGGASPSDAAASDGFPFDEIPADTDATDAAADDAGRGDAGVDAAVTTTFACGSAGSAYAGALCGPADRPCAVLRDEILPGSVGFHRDRPYLFMDERDAMHVMFTTAVSEVPHGFVAEPDPAGGDDWIVAATPFDYSSGGLGRGPDGTWIALVEAANYQSTALWLKDGPNWIQQWSQTHETSFEPRAATIASDHAGCVHAALSSNYGRWNGTWAWTPLTAFPGTYTSVAALSLSADGTPHVLVRHDAKNADASTLTWEIPGSPPEAISTQTRNPGGYADQLAVSRSAFAGPRDVVHALFIEQTPVRRETNAWLTKQLIYARRDSAHWWSRRVDDGGATWVGDCDGTPVAGGPACHKDDVDIQSIAIVAVSPVDGDVLAFYSRRHFIYDYEAKCTTIESTTTCAWSQTGFRTAAEVVVAWPEGTGIDSAVLLHDVYPFSASTAIDSAGRVHLVFSDEASYQFHGGDVQRNPIHHLVIGAR